MPDESCRTCGGVLISCSICPECRKVTQRICRLCGSKTEQQFHDSCLYIESLTTRNGMEIDIVTPHQPSHKKKAAENKINRGHIIRDQLLVFGIVGFFVLGFATASYLDLFESSTSEAQTIKSISTHEPFQYLNNGIDAFYENCLGSGTKKSITVTCPNGKGYVYKAVLVMPHELATKFSNEVFSIRGISLTKNSDSSVILKYQNNFYSTSFLQTERKV